MARTWVVYTLAAVLMWGLWGLTSKLAVRHIDPRSAVVYKSVGIVVVTLLVLAWVGFAPATSRPGVSWAFASGLFSAAGGVLLLLALRRGAASAVFPLSALYPAVVVVLAAVVLREPVTLQRAMGVVLAVAAGMLLTL